MKQAFLAAVILALTLPSQVVQAAKTKVLPLGSDLADIVRFELNIFEDAKPILESMQQSSPWHDTWFGKGRFTQIALDSGKQRWRAPVALQSDVITAPSARPNERAWIIAAAMLTTEVEPKIVFRRFKVVIGR